VVRKFSTNEKLIRYSRNSYYLLLLQKERNTMPTQSGDDTQKPTALAKVYLEDGTVLTGISFGSHKSVEGEVREIKFYDLEEIQIMYTYSWVFRCDI
jgi:hypothetical protein